MSGWRSPHDSHNNHQGKKNALAGAIALSLIALFIQVVGAWYTSSIALLGDSMHLFTDLLSLVMSLTAVILAARPADSERSFGLYRLEVLASFVNGMLLLVVSTSLVFEGLTRFWNPTEIKSLPLLWVAVVGLVFNLLSAALLYNAAKKDRSGSFQPASCAHGHSHVHVIHEHHHHDHGSGGHGHEHHHHDRNLQSALLHVWSDALGSVAVIAGAIAIYFTGLFWIDAFVGILLALWIFRWAVRVILDSAHVLLESTPRHVHTEKLVAKLRSLDQRVEGVEDLHVWELTSRMYAATAEVRVREMSLEQAEGLREKMHSLMHEQFGIAHVVLAIRPK